MKVLYYFHHNPDDVRIGEHDLISLYPNVTIMKPEDALR